MPCHNKAFSLIDCQSTKYKITLMNKNKKINQSVNTCLPLQKYVRVIHSITYVSNIKMANAFLIQSFSNVTDIKSQSLRKNSDALILQPTFFADYNINVIGKSKHCKQLKDGIELNKIIRRGCSLSLVSLRIKNDMNQVIENKNKNKQPKHESHIQHGICAVLQNIVLLFVMGFVVSIIINLHNKTWFTNVLHIQ